MVINNFKECCERCSYLKKYIKKSTMVERKPFEDPVEKNCIEIGCKHENVCKWYAELVEN